jgi:hypothetical protein
MTDDFKNNDEFDTYAWDTGRWSYDNGSCYKGEFFGASYVQDELQKNDVEIPNYLLLLRNGDISNRTLIIHVLGTKLTEIWSGQVDSKNDFDNMMGFLREYTDQNQV